jgi:hypothetical protein
MNVWKYQLGDDVTIELPEGAKILHVGMQDNFKIRCLTL